jgi:EthD domain
VTKLVTFIRGRADVDRHEFARFWREDVFGRFVASAAVGDHLVRAVHNHVLPIEVRPDAPQTASMWSGIGTYTFDSEAAARAVLSGPDLPGLVTQCGDALSEITHLLCNEVFIFDKRSDAERSGDAPALKMFAFFKRIPSLTRAEALAHYEVDHAAIANNKHNPIVKYLQNHVVEGYTNPDARYAYDGGPESWFRSLDEARALFDHPKSMELAARDEERFVIRDELAHFFTDEVEVYVRDGANG